jgi:hypothetical protein
MICTKKWRILPPPRTQPVTFASLGILRTGPAQAGPAAGSSTPLSNLARSIDLSGCGVTGLLEKKQIELPWGAEERKTYSNTTTRSSMTKEVTISKELTRSSYSA